MKRIFLAVSAVALLTLATGPSLLAQKGKAMESSMKWDFLGEARVDGKVDHDVIKVGASKGMYRGIQLKVAGGAIEFGKVTVHFGNGTSENLDIREKIPAGGKTRVIDLPGERRVIQSVEFYYEKANWRTRPSVKLYAKH